MTKKYPKLDALFYKSAGGAEPARDWLLSLSKEDRKKIGETIAYVQFKWPIGKPQADHLSGPVWEVRTTLKTRIARVFFSVNGHLLLLHGVIKKAQKADQKDINLALKRYRDWKDYEEN